MSVVRLHEVTIDCTDVVREARFWSGLLGGEPSEPMPGWLRLAPSGAGAPMVNFQPVPEPKRGKTRVHLDLLAEDLEAATAWVIRLGGRPTGERHAYDEGTVAVFTDPEGVEFCIVAYRDAPEGASAPSETGQQE